MSVRQGDALSAAVVDAAVVKKDIQVVYADDYSKKYQKFGGCSTEFTKGSGNPWTTEDQLIT